MVMEELRNDGYRSQTTTIGVRKTTKAKLVRTKPQVSAITGFYASS
jgi:hypothetical protein